MRLHVHTRRHGDIEYVRTTNHKDVWPASTGTFNLVLYITPASHIQHMIFCMFLLLIVNPESLFYFQLCKWKHQYQTKSRYGSSFK
ncbi:hypothetical protein BS17DRAFT_742589 [Gyrodon lividus]|nr:hypothetical protein BS17DRAFT_742589 [Gyrodon lividus]